MRLFSWFILRRLAREPLRSVTTALGIALGVAVIVAIQLTNASSLAGFETALDTVSGRASLEVTGTGLGVDERRMTELTWLREYGEVAPIIEGEAVLRQPGRPAERLRVLGIDILRDRPFRDYRVMEYSGGPSRRNDSERSSSSSTLPSDAGAELGLQQFLELLADPGSAILTARFAGPRGLRVGSPLSLNMGDRSIPLTVRGLLSDEGPARLLDGRFVLMDIAGAQQALDRFGRVDRIEVRVARTAAIAEAESAIARRLPAGLTVQRPARRGEQVEHMLAAFHLNLTALSYVALLVGLFLVYNTVSVAVLSRREEIGTLRALGVGRGHVRALFLAEAAALSAAGSALGIVVGRVLADGAVALTSTAVSAIYIATAAAPPSLGWRQLALAFATAVPLALLAAFLPAQEAAGVPPTAAIRGADRTGSRRRPPRRQLWTSAVLLGLAGWLASLGPVKGLPIFGYASAFAVVFGASLLVPSILLGVVGGIVGPVRRILRVEDWLAVTNLSASVPRLSISVAALAVSLSMMVAIAIMIGSFRQTVVYWVGQTLQADLFISPGASRQPGSAGTLSPDVVRLVTASPDVEAVDRFRIVEVPYADTGIRVGGGEFAVLLAHGSLLFKAPSDAREAMRRAIGEDVVVVSESLSLKHRVRPGDTVTLPTEHGPVTFHVAAVYYDYSSDRGGVMMDRPVFERHYGDRAASGLTVYLRDGIDPEDARERLLATIGEAHQVFINTNRSLRAEVLRIFDSTFTITYALELIAILVAILGVAGTLVTLILERERDLLTLRLVGAGPRQIRRMVVGEAIMIGAVSQGMGLLVGFALSLLLIYVINVQSFGWTIQFHLPTAFLLQSSVLMVVATALAGLYPARRAVRLTMKPAEQHA